MGNLSEGSEKLRVALVLGSGGLKCAAALGVQKILEREDIEISMVVGCSGGGVYASMIALDYGLERAQEITDQGWTKKNLTKYRYRPFVNMVLPKFMQRDEPFCVLDDTPILGVLQDAFGGKTFADTVKPLHLLTTDIETGEGVILSEGSILDAVRASMAIPIIFPPWRVGDRWLVDGALTNPLPIDIAIREGADVILAMGFEYPPSVALKSLGSLASQTIFTIVNNLLASTFAFYSAVHHAEIIPIMPVFDQPIALSDTHLLPYIIEEGERAAEAQVPYLRRLLASGVLPG